MTSRETFWGIKIPPTWLFVQHLVQTNNKENIRAPHQWSFVKVPFTNSYVENISMTWRHHENSYRSRKQREIAATQERQKGKKSINTLRPRQNGLHFLDVIFKCIFLNENVWISITIALKFVSKGPINDIPALVQIMAWRRSGDKPLSEPMMFRLPTHICVTRPQCVKWHAILLPVTIRLFLGVSVYCVGARDNGVIEKRR